MADVYALADAAQRGEVALHQGLEQFRATLG
jgi:hypothetical protein